MDSVNLYQMFGTDTLRHRESARKVVERLSTDLQSTQVTIDFADITFASRSFLHELLCRLGSRKVVFENRNEEVQKMMNVAQKGLISSLC